MDSRDCRNCEEKEHGKTGRKDGKRHLTGKDNTGAHTDQQLPVLQLTAAVPKSTANKPAAAAAAAAAAAEAAAAAAAAAAVPAYDANMPTAGKRGPTTRISANTSALAAALTWQKMLLLTMPRMYPSLHLLFR
jgi:hypothetical protein